MTVRRRRIAACVVSAAAILIIILLMAFGEQISSLIVNAESPKPSPSRTVRYWAHGDLDPNDDIPAKDQPNNFGYNRFKAAEEAVKNGKTKSVQSWIAMKDGSGDLFDSMRVDPALTAAVALYLDQLKVTGDDPILKDEQSLPVGERADAAHLRFIKNPSEWDEAFSRVKGILCAKDVKIYAKAISGTYTSMMHMVPNALEGNKPAVVNQYCNGLTGHLIIFEVAQGDKVIKVQLRLECGYQPVDVPDWPPPGDPPKKPPYNPPDNPPEEKKKKDDPQNRPKADQYDFYSPDRVNHDPDTTPTSEPESPDSYVAPDRPPDVIKTPNSNSDSSSVPDNHNNGGTESHDGKKYEVEAGDGSSHTDLTDVADPNNPNKPDVDPALKDDGVNKSEVTNFE